MARRVFNPKPKELPVAFTPKKSNLIRREIEAMETKQVKLAKQDFSALDLLDLFINPGYHDILRQAWDLVEPAGTTQELWALVDKPGHTLDSTAPVGQRNPFCHLRFSWHRSNLERGFYVPYLTGSRKDKAVRFRPDADRDRIERFMQVATDLCDIHWRFSLCLSTFDALNKPGVCGTPAQMRYVWPCLFTLVTRALGEEEAIEIAEPSARAGDQVNLWGDLVQKVKPTNDTLMRALLLDDVEASGKPPINYDLVYDFPRG